MLLLPFDFLTPFFHFFFVFISYFCVFSSHEDDLIIYPYSLASLGLTRGTGCQTYFQVYRAKGIRVHWKKLQPFVSTWRLFSRLLIILILWDFINHIYIFLTIFVPVSGGWGDWGAYSRCSSSCGDGTQYRLRSCNSPTPLNEGETCEGSDREERFCSNAPCQTSGQYFIGTRSIKLQMN